MDTKYIDQFELINNSLWLLLKKYVSDDKPYKSIMSELFNIFMESDKKENKYTDEWWENVGRLYDCPDKYRKQDICVFAIELADSFYEYFKLQKKRKVTIDDYYRLISKPFLLEWQRLKSSGNHTGVDNGKV